MGGPYGKIVKKEKVPDVLPYQYKYLSAKHWIIDKLPLFQSRSSLRRQRPKYAADCRQVLQFLVPGARPVSDYAGMLFAGEASEVTMV